jgi:hypothetical protein
LVERFRREQQPRGPDLARLALLAAARNTEKHGER